MNYSLKSALFVILFLVRFPVEGQNINCNGKPFHCVNSTHFKICVDLGGGVSQTVDDFMIPCPSNTFCEETNQYECEYQVSSPAPAKQSEVTTEATSSDVIFKKQLTGIIPLSTNISDFSDISYSTVSKYSTYATEEIATPPEERSTLPSTISNSIRDIIQSVTENSSYNLTTDVFTIPTGNGDNNTTPFLVTYEETTLINPNISFPFFLINDYNLTLAHESLNRSFLTVNDYNHTTENNNTTPNLANSNNNYIILLSQLGSDYNHTTIIDKKRSDNKHNIENVNSSQSSSLIIINENNLTENIDTSEKFSLFNNLTNLSNKTTFDSTLHDELFDAETITENITSNTLLAKMTENLPYVSIEAKNNSIRVFNNQVETSTPNSFFMTNNMIPENVVRNISSVMINGYSNIIENANKIMPTPPSNENVIKAIENIDNRSLPSVIINISNLTEIVNKNATPSSHNDLSDPVNFTSLLMDNDFTENVTLSDFMTRTENPIMNNFTNYVEPNTYTTENMNNNISFLLSDKYVVNLTENNDKNNIIFPTVSNMPNLTDNSIYDNNSSLPIKNLTNSQQNKNIFTDDINTNMTFPLVDNYFSENSTSITNPIENIINHAQSDLGNNNAEEIATDSNKSYAVVNNTNKTYKKDNINKIEITDNRTPLFSEVSNLNASNLIHINISMDMITLPTDNVTESKESKNKMTSIVVNYLKEPTISFSVTNFTSNLTGSTTNGNMTSYLLHNNPVEVVSKNTPSYNNYNNTTEYTNTNKWSLLAVNDIVNETNNVNNNFSSLLSNFVTHPKQNIGHNTMNSAVVSNTSNLTETTRDNKDDLSYSAVDHASGSADYIHRNMQTYMLINSQVEITTESALYASVDDIVINQTEMTSKHTMPFQPINFRDITSKIMNNSSFTTTNDASNLTENGSKGTTNRVINTTKITEPESLTSPILPTTTYAIPINDEISNSSKVTGISVNKTLHIDEGKPVGVNFAKVLDDNEKVDLKKPTLIYSLTLKEPEMEFTTNNPSQNILITAIDNQMIQTSTSPVLGRSSAYNEDYRQYSTINFDDNSNITDVSNVLEKEVFITSQTYVTKRPELFITKNMTSFTTNNPPIDPKIKSDSITDLKVPSIDKYFVFEPITASIQDINKKFSSEPTQLTSPVQASTNSKIVEIHTTKSLYTHDYTHKYNGLTKEMIEETTLMNWKQDLTTNVSLEKIKSLEHSSNSSRKMDTQIESVLADQLYINSDTETVSPQILSSVESRQALRVTKASESTSNHNYLLDNIKSLIAASSPPIPKSNSPLAEFTTTKEESITYNLKSKNSENDKSKSNLTEFQEKIPKQKSKLSNNNPNETVAQITSVTNHSERYPHESSYNRTNITLLLQDIIKRPSIKSNNLNITYSTYCLNRPDGKYADQNNCSRFYVCVGGIAPLVGECPFNTVFSDLKRLCTKNLSHCVRNNQFMCLANGRYYDIFLKNTYYICVWHKNRYVKFKFQCHNGYSLNKTIIQCVPDQKNTNSSSSDHDSSIIKEGSTSTEFGSKVTNEFECVREGKFADPNSCNKYFVCSKNKKSEFRRRIKNCDSDKVWNTDKQKCVDEDSYECQVS